MLLRLMSSSLLSMFSSRSLMVPGLTFMFLIHFQFIFVHVVIEGSQKVKQTNKQTKNRPVGIDQRDGCQRKWDGSG